MKINLRRRTLRLLRFDEKLRTHRKKLICGVDEAGRGPLAGPVVAAAVIFNKDAYIEGIFDSKQVLPDVRENLFEKIIGSALAVGVGICDNNQVDEMNILNATTLAMNIALSELKVEPHLVIVDGNHFKRSLPLSPDATSSSGVNTGEGLGVRLSDVLDIIGGDEKSFSIAAASIIAKVTRDRMMKNFEQMFPTFRFGKHKGYSTAEHVQEIEINGLTSIHRKSFKVKALMPQELVED